MRFYGSIGPTVCQLWQSKIIIWTNSFQSAMLAERRPLYIGPTSAQDTHSESDLTAGALTRRHTYTYTHAPAKKR